MFSSVLSLARRPQKCSPFFSVRAAYASTSQNSRLATKRSVIEADTNAYDELADTTQLLDAAPTRAKPSSDAFSVTDYRETLRTRPRRHQRKGNNTPNFIKPADFLDQGEFRRYPRKMVTIGPGARESRQRDVFHQLDIDPLYEAMNPTLLSAFVTEMGKVRKRAQTNLTWRSQRRVAKAIKRAKLMGIMPMFHRMDPELPRR